MEGRNGINSFHPLTQQMQDFDLNQRRVIIGAAALEQSNRVPGRWCTFRLENRCVSILLPSRTAVIPDGR